VLKYLFTVKFQKTNAGSVIVNIPTKAQNYYWKNSLLIEAYKRTTAGGSKPYDIKYLSTNIASPSLVFKSHLKSKLSELKKQNVIKLDYGNIETEKFVDRDYYINHGSGYIRFNGSTLISACVKGVFTIKTKDGRVEMASGVPDKDAWFFIRCITLTGNEIYIAYDGDGWIPARYKSSYTYNRKTNDYIEKVTARVIWLRPYGKPHNKLNLSLLDKHLVEQAVAVYVKNTPELSGKKLKANAKVH